MDKDTLYARAIAGHTDARVILAKKADKLNRYKRTILHIEAMHGYKERVQFILSEFVNKNLLSKVDEYKQTALQLTADYGKTKVVEVLIDAARHLPFFKFFLRKGNQDEETALHLVVKRGNMDIARLLVNADPDDRHIQNSDGETPIYIAADIGHNHIVKIICTTCTYPNLQGPDGTTALHAALAKFPYGMQFLYHSTCLHNIYCIYEIKRI